jgi:hypothetical protein
MSIKKFLEYSLIIISSILFFCLFINFLIFFKAESIVKQKIIPKNILNTFPIESTCFYADTYKDKENYIAIVGDSHAFGSGEAYLQNKKDYSIGHHLYSRLDRKINFFNFGIPGGGSNTILKHFLHCKNLLKSHPKKVIYLFYEGNDLENNIKEHLSLKKKKKQKNYYFPIIKIIKRFISINFRKKKKNKSKETNTYIMNDTENKIHYPLQSPPIELSNEELKLSLNILFSSIKKIKQTTENIVIVYIPSPTSVLDLKNPITIQQYFKNRKKKLFEKKQLTDLSNTVKMRVKSFSKINNISFIDVTDNLINIANKKHVYGPVDFKHPNYLGYKIISDKLFMELKSKL